MTAYLTEARNILKKPRRPVLARIGIGIAPGIAFCIALGIALSIPAYAQSVSSNPAEDAPPTKAIEAVLDVNPIVWQGSFGLDAWDTQSSLTVPSLTLGLPKWTTAWPARDISPWGHVQMDYRAGQNISVSAKAQANQEFGGRVDELMIDYAFSPSLGVRAGIVDMKTSWCADYEADVINYFDVDKFCSSLFFKKIAGSNPGVQLYSNFSTQNYRFQILAGVYDPKILDYQPDEFGALTLRPGLAVDYMKKVGLAFNAVNVPTGTEFRLSITHANASQSLLTEADANFPEYLMWTNLRSNLLYLAFSTPIAANINIQASQIRYYGDFHTFYIFPHPGGPLYDFVQNEQFTDSAIKITYLASQKDSFHISYADYTNSIDLDFEGSTSLDLFNHRRGLALGYRHQWNKSLYTSMEYLRVLDYRVNANQDRSPAPPRFATGNSLGFRLGYMF